MFASLPAWARAGRLPGPYDYEKDAVLVKFRAWPQDQMHPGQNQALDMQAGGAEAASARQALRVLHGVAQKQALPFSCEHWRLAEGGSVPETLKLLKQSPLVEYAEPNYQRAALAPRADGPNDPYYQSGAQWWLEHIQADRLFAENRVPQGQEVVIAVLDSGIAANHEDLAARLVPGKDFINPNGTAEDEDGHGTHVAGIAGAVAGNSAGIAGVACGAPVKLMPVKIMQDRVGYDSDIAQGIRWAADHGARVLNLSFGSEAMGRYLEEAVDYAYNRGCVLVGAAGNDAVNEYGQPYNPKIYPAAYGKVIAVAACTRAGVRAAYSEFHDYVDLAAPGGDDGTTAEMIISAYAWSPASYVYQFGTSMAAPIVSGTAALLIIQDPTRSPEAVKEQMVITADKIGTLAQDADGWDRYLGWGRVNAYQALTHTLTFTPAPAGRQAYNYPNPFQPTRGESTCILIPAADNGQAATLRIFDSLGYLLWTKDVPAAQVYPGQVISWDGRDKNGDWVANGVYPFVLEVGDKVYRNKIAVLN
ncbi:S8 family serine peptidase [candidate division FCPU426 bacterium]|nr:S8 family serine peptidase [candidate division FCPU426 bacterium]